MDDADASVHPTTEALSEPTLRFEGKCPACHGAGQLIPAPQGWCTACDGTGWATAPGEAAAEEAVATFDEDDDAGEYVPKDYIVIVRHGSRYDYAYPDAWQAQCTERATPGSGLEKRDPPLSRHGRREAAAVAGFLEPLIASVVEDGGGDVRVLSSPYLRCMQTAMPTLDMVSDLKGSGTGSPFVMAGKKLGAGGVGGVGRVGGVAGGVAGGVRLKVEPAVGEWKHDFPCSVPNGEGDERAWLAHRTSCFPGVLDTEYIPAVVYEGGHPQGPVRAGMDVDADAGAGAGTGTGTGGGKEADAGTGTGAGAGSDTGEGKTDGIDGSDPAPTLSPRTASVMPPETTADATLRRTLRGCAILDAIHFPPAPASPAPPTPPTPPTTPSTPSTAPAPVAALAAPRVTVMFSHAAGVVALACGFCGEERLNAVPKASPCGVWILERPVSGRGGYADPIAVNTDNAGSADNADNTDNAGNAGIAPGPGVWTPRVMNATVHKPAPNRGCRRLPMTQPWQFSLDKSILWAAMFHAVVGGAYTARARTCAARMKAAGVRAVAFDMDQTMTSAHSWGKMTAEGTPLFEAYVAAVSPAFKALVPALAEVGIHLAVATHSDREENIAAAQSGAVLLGEDLVGPVLVRSVPDFAEQFFVVAYNIRARGEEGLRAENSGKNVHVRRVAEHYGVELGSVLLLDDDSRNIRDTKGCHVVRVDPTMGLRMGDLEARGLPWQPPCREEDKDVATWWAGFLLGAGGGEAKE